MERFLRHAELLREKVPDWKAYPFSIPAVAHLDRLDLSAAVTFFVGENGSGKSTLLEALAIQCGFNPEGGTKNFRSANRPSESRLHEFLRLARGAKRERSGFFLRAETMFNLATEAETGGYSAYGWENLHDKSHGEAFLWVALERFPERGLFFLDEPESALSPQRQLALLVRIHELVRSGSQFVISTHSPILTAVPDARIFQFDERGIRPIAYEETDAFVVTRSFLTRRAKMLDELLGGDAPGRH